MVVDAPAVKLDSQRAIVPTDGADCRRIDGNHRCIHAAILRRPSDCAKGQLRHGLRHADSRSTRWRQAVQRTDNVFTNFTPLLSAGLDASPSKDR